MPVISPEGIGPNPQPPSEGPCTWPIKTGCCPDWDTFDPEVQADATAWATEILWALSGRRFGPCTITVRPCGSTCNFAGGWMTFPVFLDGGTASAAGGWFPFVDRMGNWRNCACRGACSCEARCQVWLPGPVVSVTEVNVDGVTLDPSSYRVDNQNLLVRTDGECWPECQNFDLSEFEDEDTFFVTYERGTPVPTAGQIAAGILACSFAKSCVTGCGLPGNLANIDRQGVTIEFVDVSDQLTAGFTGIPFVDSWLRAVNPNRLTHRLRVSSRDINFPRMPTT
jgi:hypothetical protein